MRSDSFSSNQLDLRTPVGFGSLNYAPTPQNWQIKFTSLAPSSTRSSTSRSTRSSCVPPTAHFLTNLQQGARVSKRPQVDIQDRRLQEEVSDCPYQRTVRDLPGIHLPTTLTFRQSSLVPRRHMQPRTRPEAAATIRSHDGGGETIDAKTQAGKRRVRGRGRSP